MEMKFKDKFENEDVYGKSGVKIVSSWTREHQKL